MQSTSYITIRNLLGFFFLFCLSTPVFASTPTKWDDCTLCDGSGKREMRCPKCPFFKGWVPGGRVLGNYTRIPCKRCGGSTFFLTETPGSGWVKGTCNNCGGSGKVEAPAAPAPAAPAAPAPVTIIIAAAPTTEVTQRAAAHQIAKIIFGGAMFFPDHVPADNKLLWEYVQEELGKLRSAQKDK